MFDWFKDLFSSWFGSDDEEITDFGGDEPVRFSPEDLESGDVEEAWEIQERLIEDHSGGEYVQEFYDLAGVVDYLEGTPESVLKIMIDPTEEIYYVYRYPSD